MKLIGKLKKLTHNDKIALKNVSGAFLIKGISLLISFISLPLYIKYFNDDIVLGLWFTLLSVLSWLLTFDFGIGNGLRNKLVKAISNNDKDLVKKYISSSYAYLGIIVLGFLVVITPFLFFLDWGKILNVSTNVLDSKTLLIVVAINYFTIVFQFFLRLITFILYAIQKSAVNNFLVLITTLLQLLFILIYRGSSTVQNIVILSLVHMVCVLTPLLIATVWVFTKSLNYATPTIRSVDFKIGKEIISLGGKFFWIQIMYLGLTGTNAFFISNIIGPQEVVEYQIYYKIYTLVAVLVSLALTPFWSLITKAKFENDWIWIKKYFKYVPIIILLIFIAQIAAVLLNDWLFRVWLGDEYIDTVLNYTLILASFGLLYSLQAILSTFANGLNKINNQLIVFTLGFIFKVAFLYGFKEEVINWSIIVLIDIIIFSVYCSIDSFSIYRYISKKHNQHNQFSNFS